jgi:hypothetical protein
MKTNPWEAGVRALAWVQFERRWQLHPGIRMKQLQEPVPMQIYVGPDFSLHLHRYILLFAFRNFNKRCRHKCSPHSNLCSCTWPQFAGLLPSAIPGLPFAHRIGREESVPMETSTFLREHPSLFPNAFKAPTALPGFSLPQNRDSASSQFQRGEALTQSRTNSCPHSIGSMRYLVRT